jgi:hypothetical protein
VKRFFYDGDNVVLIADRYFQDSGEVDGTPLTIHGLSTNLILNDLGVDRPLASVGYLGFDTGCGGSPIYGRSYFYHADERGSIRNVSYESSSVCVGTGYSYQGWAERRRDSVKLQARLHGGAERCERAGVHAESVL